VRSAPASAVAYEPPETGEEKRRMTANAAVERQR
jgi:hypothetical protein